MNCRTGETGAADAEPPARRLESWKRIAHYLNRDVRTVQRWEAAEGLPIHRLQHHRQGSIFAYVDELDAWLEARAAGGPRAGPGKRLMLAVLPFDNLSGEAERSYFSDGLSEDLITELGRVNPEQLGVIARTSVMRYRDTNKDVAEIGTELGVDFILEGSVRLEGERLRLTAQLIDVSDQTHRWARSYNRSMRAVLDLQAELATHVARAIQVELGTSRERAGIAPPTDPEAYELLQLGKHHLHRWTRDGFVKARRYLRQASLRDPGLAAAQAWLAMSDLAVAFYELEPREEAYARAVQAAHRSLELDPQESQALVVLAFKAYKYDWDWARSEQLFRQAASISPNSPWPHWGYAHLLDSLGRHEEAIAEARLALRLDPVSLFTLFAAQFTLWNARRYDEALDACNEAHERLPESPRAYLQCLKEVYERTGQYEAAIDTRARLSELGPAAGYYYKTESGGRNIAPLREAFSQLGPAGYWAWLKALRDEPGEYHAVNRAVARVQLGEFDEAIAVLEGGFERRDHSMTEIKIEPLLDPLRDDARFQDLLRRMRLD